MNQMWIPLKQPLPLPQGLAYLSNVPVLEVAQTAMNEARRATGGARGEVVLFDQQRTPSGARTFASDGDSIDSAANYDDMAEASPTVL
jgi:hypothetical protein